MAKSFDNSAGILYENDVGFFDGPDPDLIGLLGQAMPTAEAFGTLRANQQHTPTAIASAEAFGVFTTTQIVETPTAIPSAEAVSNIQINLHFFPSSIASAESFGTLLVGPIFVPDAIPSLEALGTPTMQLVLHPIGVPSLEDVISPLVIKQWEHAVAAASISWTPETAATSNWTSQTPQGGDPWD